MSSQGQLLLYSSAWPHPCNHLQIYIFIYQLLLPIKSSLLSQLPYFCQGYDHSTSHTKSNALGILQPYLSFMFFNQIQTHQSLLAKLAENPGSPLAVIQEPWELSPQEWQTLTWHLAC